MRWLFGRNRRAHDDLDDEIRTHLEMAERDRLDRGALPDEARARARREFGNVLLIKETTRAMSGGSWLLTAGQDLRYALRVWVRYPAYVLTGIVTLALAVGATLVVFSVVNALWLKSAPIDDPDRVVVVGRDFETPDGSRYSDRALDLLRQHPIFEGVAGQVVTSGVQFEGLPPFLSVGAVQAPFESAWVTPEYFPVLGIALAGRGFERGDGARPGPAPAVISHRLWRTAFKGRPDILGEVLDAQPEALEVVGIAPAGFQGARRGERIDLWLPHRLLPRLTGTTLLPMVAFARLSPGVSVEGARATLAQGARSDPAVVALSAIYGATDLPMVLVGSGDFLTMAMLISGLVLVGGCATLMALTLLYYDRRGRELAVRGALGATRPRLVSQLTTELTAVAILGTITAVWLAGIVVDLLPHTTLPGGVDLSRLDLTMDWRVAALAIACCIVALGVASAAPIARFTRATVALGLVTPTATSPRASTTFRQTVLVGHIAVTTLLLVGASLFVESAIHAFALGPGFDAERVIFATVQTRHYGTRDEQALPRAVTAGLDAVERIGAMPGVQAVALGAAPLSLEEEFRLRARTLTFETETGGHDLSCAWLPVGHQYLEALGVPLLAGRHGLKNEAVVTPSLAAALWSDEVPLGKRLRFGSVTTTVVGVADFAVGSVRLGRPPAVLYFGDSTVATMVNGAGRISLTIRANSAREAMTTNERTLSAAFPDAPVIDVTAAEDLVNRDLSRERLAAWVFSGFGAVALLLAAVSVLGVVLSVIDSRWQELGLRQALGAGRNQLVWHVLRESLRPTVVGAAVGLTASVAFARTLESYLFGVTRVDPAIGAAVFASVVACALCAGAIACRRLWDLSLVDSLKGH